MPRDFDRVEQTLNELWGSPSLPVDAGVLHVVATWADGEAMRAIRISEQSPKSPIDFFLLNLARARADAIITTGQILRDEPALEYTLPEPWRADLLRWRERRLGRARPPRLAVLSSGRDLDLDHPAFSGWAEPAVITDATGSARIASAAAQRRVPVVELQGEGVRGAVRTLAAQGARTICIEAGPTTARALYAAPFAVDELMWSEYEEPTLGAAHRGGVVFERPTVLGKMGTPAASGARIEPSGRWSFSRYLRR